MSAVHGGAYILGHEIISLEEPQQSQESEDATSAVWKFRLRDVPDILTANLFISKPGHPQLSHLWPQSMPENNSTSPPVIVKCVAVIPSPVEEDMTALRVFPPGSFVSQQRAAHDKAVASLITGSDTMSCPRDSSQFFLQLII
jgi:hypothetical protein